MVSITHILNRSPFLSFFFCLSLSMWKICLLFENHIIFTGWKYWQYMLCITSGEKYVIYRVVSKRNSNNFRIKQWSNCTNPMTAQFSEKKQIDEKHSKIQCCIQNWLICRCYRVKYDIIIQCGILMCSRVDAKLCRYVGNINWHLWRVKLSYWKPSKNGRNEKNERKIWKNWLFGFRNFWGAYTWYLQWEKITQSIKISFSEEMEMSCRHICSHGYPNFIRFSLFLNKIIHNNAFRSSQLEFIFYSIIFWISFVLSTKQIYQ